MCEPITFGKDNLPGYIVGDVNNPAMLVIQEWWGVNDVSFYRFAQNLIFDFLEVKKPLLQTSAGHQKPR
jgi:hypothetical protein